MDGTVVAAVFVAMLIVAGVGRWLAGRRRAGSEARRRAMTRGQGVQFPVRIRGRAPEYPSYWRAGNLSSKDGIYRPWGRWGEELELAGMTIVQTGVVSAGEYGLKGAYESFTVLECVDSAGRNVLIAADEGDVETLTEALELPSRAPEPPLRMHGLRWLRNRVYLGIVLMVVLGAITGTPLTIAIATSTSVEATITLNPGGDKACSVEARHEGRSLTGTHPCEVEVLGDRVQMFVLGWPLSGTLGAPETYYVLVFMTWLPAWLGLMFMAIMKFQQRRLPRHRLGAHPTTAAS